MKRYILHENTVDTVFDLDKTIEIPTIFHSAPIIEVLANEINDYDIVDKTAEFKQWVIDTWNDLESLGHTPTKMDFRAYTSVFISNVLGLSLFGAELMHGLDDYGIELYIKEFKYTTPVLEPNPAAIDNTLREKKHIINWTSPEAYLAAWKLMYISKFIRAFIEQYFIGQIPADIINQNIGHLWVLEYKEAANDLKKEIRKAFYDIKMARNLKQFDKVVKIKERLTKLLKDVDWKMVWRLTGDNQKTITYGRGINKALLDIFDNMADIEISQFEISGDF